MFLPITKVFFDENELKNVKKVLESGWVAQGSMVSDFERKIAEHEGVKFAAAVSNCTTALHLALIVNNVKSGHDVIVPSYTYVATANAVEYTGAVPVFCDIELSTLNISVECINNVINNAYEWDDNLEHLVNIKTGNILKAIIPVHLFGLCADMYSINDIAKKYNLKIIEDGACALGAKIGNIHPGGFGNISCLSFHPRKCITTGEGGMILTDNNDFYNRLKELRSHAVKISADQRNHDKKGSILPEIEEVGYNYRLSDIQAAVGLAQTEKLDYIISKRVEKALIYNDLLKDISQLIIPVAKDNYYHTYQSYVCMLRDDNIKLKDLNEIRNNIMFYLEENGIQVRQGTYAVHTLKYYKEKYALNEFDYINSYKADRLSIALPLYPQISTSEQSKVAELLSEAIKKFWIV